jgi:phosphoribosyl-ATP pyrophosphohydrolase/phosphoribosyl-AMP cyclohydrolase
MNHKVHSPQLPLRLEGAQSIPDWSKALAFAADQPLVLPMICQDSSTGQVLMVGYVSAEALEASLSLGHAVFWSRSRGRLWKKGETSGHVLQIRRILIDCDGDALLALVDPAGPACHRDSVTCFDAPSGQGGFSETDVGWSVLARLQKTLETRAEGADPESYTYKLLNAGLDRVLRKLGEECTEAILAAKNSTITGNADEFLQESADLLYHWLVALKAVNRKPEDVLEVLRSREGGPRRALMQKI